MIISNVNFVYVQKAYPEGIILLPTFLVRKSCSEMNPGLRDFFGN
jgi:hypothetical protein